MLVPFEEPAEFDFFQNKLCGKIYISKRFLERDSGKNARFASKVIDGQEIHQFFKELDELVLHTSEGDRYEIKALFYEDTREIKTLTLQRFIKNTGKPQKVCVTLVDNEIKTLVDFISCIAHISIDEEVKSKIDDEVLKQLILTKEQAAKLYNNNKSAFEEMFKNEITVSDIVALGYKKEQLKCFEKLLNDKNFFESEKHRTFAKGDEQVWQNFFEKNTWILGYGLDYIFNSPLENQKLEQVVKGYDVFGAGKRVDALMKTRGIINSLCFCEIKTHHSELIKPVKNSYRAECWAISDELAGGVAQIQKTVQKSIENIKTKTHIKDRQGSLTGEEIYLYQPKSFLVIGSLSEFKEQFGTNEDKFSSFELFRQNIFNPEIITFDELLERAKFILENAEFSEYIQNQSEI